MITEYTREAGVRQLERELGKLLRGGGDEDRLGRGGGADRASTPSALRDALGRQRFFQESVERTAIPGVARPDWRSPEPAATSSSSRRPRWTATRAWC